MGYGDNLENLLQKLEEKTKPIEFKEIVLDITQLYFDGLVTNKAKKKDWPEQRETLSALKEGLKMTIIPFYKKKKINYEQVRNTLLEYHDTLKKYSSTFSCKKRHLKDSEYMVKKFYKGLNKKILEGTDIIVSIASGGFEPTILAADKLGIENILIARYSYYANEDSDILIPTAAPFEYTKPIKESNLLIVDDFIMSGRTLRSIIEWAEQYKPKNIYCTAIVSYRARIKGYDTKILSHSPYISKIEF